MREYDVSNTRWQRVGLSVLFGLCGVVVFVIFSHFHPLLPAGADVVGRVGLTLVLLVLALSARGSERFFVYWQVLFALFVASLVTSLDLYLPFSRWMIDLLNVNPDAPVGWAVDKLESTFIISAGVIVLTLLSGQNLASIFLQKGSLKLGLGFGVSIFILVAAVSGPLSELMFGGHDLSLERVLPWTPWVLIFVLGNAFNEELLFRGLFLRKLEPLIGKFPANLLMAIPFTVSHAMVDYTTDSLMFLAVLFPLALAWGGLMQKTDSVWGSVLFHAAMDIPIVLGLFS